MEKHIGHFVTKDALCSYLVNYHSLDNYDKLSGESGVKNIFKRISSIQYDPLNIAGRNASLVLQSRVSNFNTGILDKLLYKDRFLVDAYDKEMSIIRTEDWIYFNRVRISRGEDYINLLKRRGQSEALGFSEKIMEEIKRRGPLGSSDIDLGNCKSGSWGHSKISGAALDYLFTVGKLGIYDKKGVIRKYDLTENLLPKKIINAKEPFDSDIKYYEWYILRRIGSIGLHWLRNGLGWNGFFINNKNIRTETFKALEKKGLIIKINVPGINEAFYVRQQDMKILHIKPDYDNCVRILAPLDNMLWDRLIIYKLFNFQYSWEVYLPAAKRKYGYYVLPILYQNKLIARMEPDKYEIGKPLSVKNWWWEPEIIINNKIKAAVKNGLKKFCKYLETDGIDGNSMKIIFK